MPPVGFEPTISTGERPMTYALDRAATGTGSTSQYYVQINISCENTRIFSVNLQTFENGNEYFHVGP